MSVMILRSGINSGSENWGMGMTSQDISKEKLKRFGNSFLKGYPLILAHCHTFWLGIRNYKINIIIPF
jgi:hypothetical protein